MAGVAIGSGDTPLLGLFCENSLGEVTAVMTNQLDILQILVAAL